MDGLLNESFLDNFVQRNKQVIDSMSNTVNLFGDFLKTDKIKEFFQLEI